MTCSSGSLLTVWSWLAWVMLEYDTRRQTPVEHPVEVIGLQLWQLRPRPGPAQRWYRGDALDADPTTESGHAGGDSSSESVRPRSR